ncbi:MAG: hypothetical protein HUK15_05495, partial [Bacteroidales bacterium]|nr:hypothetical protein [Bacteroidales bacterium]
KTGMMVTLKFQKITYEGKSTTKLIDVEEEKTFCSVPSVSGLPNYRIIPASAPDSILTPSEQTSRAFSLQ